jgi:aminomethyltransferase
VPAGADGFLAELRALGLDAHEARCARLSGSESAPGSDVSLAAQRASTLVVAAPEYDGVWLREVAEREGLHVFVKPSTDQLHNLAVQGPESRALLSELVWTPPTQPSLAELKWFRFLIGRIGSCDGTPIIGSRTGYTGELGYEVWCHPSDGLALRDAVLAQGATRGCKPLGLEALDMLRIGSGLIFAGYEFDDQVDPFEAGIGFAVALGSDEDFIGRA